MTTPKTVSIVTVTQYSRFENLKILYEIIENQDYPFIKEWIIVEGSQTPALQTQNADNIHKGLSKRDIENADTQNTTKNFFAIHTIVPQNIVPLSNLRNIGNDHCSGDIIVCMDDDDYYPPTRVSHAVSMLSKYNRSIAGCSKIYMYDFYLQKLYKFRGFHNNHSTNNCLAYKKEYLTNHIYKDGLSISEEYHFTNGFTEPMIQLTPEKCVIMSSHTQNTVDKSPFVANHEYVMEINIDIYNMVPKEIFDKMMGLFTLRKRV
jgi:glycosyltransferase involved in cell wall biosynthesis